MLPRLRSFLKRTKSSSSKISSVSTGDSDTESVPHDSSTAINQHVDNDTAVTTLLSSSADLSDQCRQKPKRLLPSPHIVEANHTSLASWPIARGKADTRPSSHSPPAHQSAAVPTSAPTSVEKHLCALEDELSTASSQHLPWLSPLSKLPTHPDSSAASPVSSPAPSSAPSVPAKNDTKIMQRKVWVRRPGASATLVTVNDDDLVDTVRDMILRKYANSLGKSIDSPDITLKIVSREQAGKSIPLERVLGPEEPIGRTLDLYYAGGQSIEEALIIDIPPRRTPRPSPRVSSLAYPYFVDEPYRPSEAAREYFPPMAVHSPLAGQHPPPINASHPHSMAIIASGQPPTLPSPGAHSTRRRPKYGRQHTSSPTILHSHQPTTGDLKQPAPSNMNPPAALPTPPAPPDHRPSITPPNRVNSPHSGRTKKRNKGQGQQQNPTTVNGHAPPPGKASSGLLDGNVPPINVLLVEDNVINLRLLEQFMRKLKVRWKTAMNGREAVNTWRTGGFHLVLMDIQLPVMNGLEATKEIRRLESVNGIGLGLVGSQNARDKRSGSREISEEDKLGDMSLFKSPVIIVALTASSLQSDRHEALAVGCNDFLTKPVGYPWMLRKVTEWGCMQALIDFDGWRKWKAYAEKEEQGLTAEQKKAKDKEEKAQRRAELTKMFARPPPTASGSNATATADKPKEIKPNKEAKAENEAKPVSNGTSAPPRLSQRPVRGSSGSGTTLETHEEESED